METKDNKDKQPKILIDDTKPVKVKPQKLIVEKVPFWERKFWARLIDFNFDELKDRLRFSVTYGMLGLIVIVFANLLKIATLKGAGIVFFIFGVITVILAIVIPIAHYSENN